VPRIFLFFEMLAADTSPANCRVAKTSSLGRERNTNYHLTEFHFYDKHEEEIKL
jgi:hypothetical protein